MTKRKQEKKRLEEGRGKRTEGEVWWGEAEGQGQAELLFEPLNCLSRVSVVRSYLHAQHSSSSSSSFSSSSPSSSSFSSSSSYSSASTSAAAAAAAVVEMRAKSQGSVGLNRCVCAVFTGMLRGLVVVTNVTALILIST